MITLIAPGKVYIGPADSNGPWTHIGYTSEPIHIPPEPTMTAGVTYRLSFSYTFPPLRTRITPYAYRLFFGRRHPRVSSMHSAYRRRSG
jgi:hypothetical protein